MPPGPAPWSGQKPPVELGDRNHEAGVPDLAREHRLIDEQVVSMRGEAVGKRGQAPAEPGRKRGIGRVVGVDVSDVRAGQRPGVAARDHERHQGPGGERGPSPVAADDRREAGEHPRRTTPQPPQKPGHPTPQPPPAKRGQPSFGSRMHDAAGRRKEGKEVDVNACVGDGVHLPDDERLGHVGKPRNEVRDAHGASLGAPMGVAAAACRPLRPSEWPRERTAGQG